jgi:SAM-dependent methyltransferase
VDRAWEDLISLHTVGHQDFDVLGPAAGYRAIDAHPTDWSTEGEGLEEALRRDTHPLPLTQDREGYYGPHHFSYWASGHRDARLLFEAADRLGVDLRSYLDLGCASGRVLRHVALSGRGIRSMGCDINRRHTDWVAQHLPRDITVFQNHSVPTLPLPDDSVDAVTAYSVFTHIEAFETTWLMELRRVLRPGGIAWLTVQTEQTWRSFGPGWPVFDALLDFPDFQPYVHERGPLLPRPRTVFRRDLDRSYSSHVFYTRDYIHDTWGRILDVAEEHERHPDLQDVVILRKPLSLARGRGARDRPPRPAGRARRRRPAPTGSRRPRPARVPRRAPGPRPPRQ